jgi:hypothetical protein
MVAGNHDGADAGLRQRAMASGTSWRGDPSSPRPRKVSSVPPGRCQLSTPCSISRMATARTR